MDIQQEIRSGLSLWLCVEITNSRQMHLWTLGGASSFCMKIENKDVHLLNGAKRIKNVADIFYAFKNVPPYVVALAETIPEIPNAP